MYVCDCVAPLCYEQVIYDKRLFCYICSCFKTFPYSTNHCCLSLNMNRIDIKNTEKIIILYGGSLGSLFDEERSKVRESNANCRTH